MELFNTLSGRVESLTPSDGQTFRMYACGPTVYDYGHIGNFRTFIHVDVLRRTLKQLGITVRHVMNITDVDDKIIRNAALLNLDIREYSEKYEKAFFEDMKWLNVERPEVVPHATENIPEMVALIENLHRQDIAYQAEDGQLVFQAEAAFRSMASCRRKIWTGLKTARASTPTSTTRILPATSRYGRR